MAIKIAQLQNLQQLDVMVAGPDDANHLFIIDGQFDASLAIGSQGTNFATGNLQCIGRAQAHQQTVRSSNCDSFDCKNSNRQHRGGRICGMEHSGC
jgi:hypothetical protein